MKFNHGNKRGQNKSSGPISRFGDQALVRQVQTLVANLSVVAAGKRTVRTLDLSHRRLGGLRERVRSRVALGTSGAFAHAQNGSTGSRGVPGDEAAKRRELVMSGRPACVSPTFNRHVRLT